VAAKAVLCQFTALLRRLGETLPHGPVRVRVKPEHGIDLGEVGLKPPPVSFGGVDLAGELAPVGQRPRDDV
jgi:hypothetical protein